MALHAHKYHQGIANLMVVSVVLLLALVSLIPFSYLPKLVATTGSHRLPIHHLLFTLLGVIMGALSLWTLYLHGVKKPPAFIAFLAILGVAGIFSSFLAPQFRERSLQVASGLMFRGLAPALAMYSLARFYGKRDVLTSVVVSIGALVAFAGSYEALTERFFLITRDFSATAEADIFPLYFASGPIGQPLPFSVFLNLLFPISLFEYTRSRRKFFLITSFLMAVGIFLSFRRTGWVLMSVSMLLALRYSRWADLKWILLTVLLVAASILSSPSFRERVSRFKIGITISEIKHSHRTKSYATALRMWKDYPLTGVGLGMWGEHQNRYINYDTNLRSSDNQYLRTLAEGGILMMAALLGLLGYCFFRLVRERTPIMRGFVVGLGVFTLNLIVTDGLLWSALQAMFLATLGLAMGELDRIRDHPGEGSVTPSAAS